ncbi:hypothetical protein PTTG_09307 [Puccinia triticina 1-1 BBBD Race 1]|uniref:Uncharacterized protein n=2 Tax=Puccinia triticina TaxID=208348 RepID=A0A0C4F820_PUCT1|nr:uncharacterized protein PtA15_12A25 [Puccinia triticina]OAV88136.1 hypothetical protein PTTG_09307 [Puccinia triticina 1-1 BBBD Race 1]WAQ90040.1 hypothetical protein PtA15_12A25 [Puccinia triticina]WAR61339.1 hypothetical protein PtB15_12B24 [Puccinia triticina]
MKQAYFFRFTASLLALVSVDGLPADPSGTDQSKPGHDAVKTMGKLQESNCKGNKITWNKGQSPWQKVALAERLTLYQNVWQSQKVKDGGKSEITCQTFTQGNLAWQVVFDLPSADQDKDQVKAYTNVAWGVPQIDQGSQAQPLHLQVKNAKKFSTTWDWKLTDQSTDLVADVSYDIFLSTQPDCVKQECASREIMIWLSAIGKARPAGQRQAINGNPAGTIKINEKYEFQVWQGNTQVPVISIFPAEDSGKYTSFSGDLKELLKNLGSFGVSQDEYFVSVGAGIEIFKGQGKLTTSKYSLELF